jgi:hypothetical protein
MEDRSDDFCVQSSVIDYVINQNADCHIVISRGFIVDSSRAWLHTKLLTDFCDNPSLEPTTRHTVNNVDYTYSFNDIRI